MPNLIMLLVALIVLGLIYWAAIKIMAAFGIGEPIHTLVIVLIVVVGVLYVLGVFGLIPGFRL